MVSADPHNRRGILLMIAAYAFFSLLDASAKSLLPYLSPPTLVFLRYFIGLLFAMGGVLMARDLELFRSASPKTQFVRGVLLLASTAFNFSALQYLQLAQTAAIMFSNPLWVCALSHIMLKERVGPRRWGAVLVGFLGVMIIMRPGFGSFHWAMILSLLAALCGALYQLTTRRVGADDRSGTSLVYGTLWGTVCALPMTALSFEIPAGMQWPLIVFAGFCGSFGHYLLIAAHRLAPASLLAPYSYTQIVWMTGLGYALFGQTPDGLTLLGALIVVMSGLYVFHRERLTGALGRYPGKT
ncbi:MAG TPA: DMT family transporter [Aestuariivirgaceae bacterium]|jgi:drug/metabolite transporter (DMT)-like permease